MSDAASHDEEMDENLRSWDERVALHVADRSGIYDVEAFLAGGDTLMPIESVELGDIQGLRVAHLQCHFGLDTLSLARRGAKNVVGLDYSQKAISTARDLADRSSLAARFECANVYDAPRVLGTGSYDLVYVTWGALNWLPHISTWADCVSELLVSGGRLYLAECHPIMARLEWIDNQLTFAYPVDTERAERFEDPVSYAGDGTPLLNATTYEWIHSLGLIASSLVASGLRIEFLREHDTLPWPAIPVMVPAEGRMFKLPDGMSGPPASFSLSATKA